MEASLDTAPAATPDSPRTLEGEKARRIVAAMRASVAARGAAKSTFDVVARDAGVSRGLLHYYFGSKERLLVEVVRRDCDARIADLERALAEAGTVDEIVASLVATLESFVAADTGVPAVLYELLSVSRQSDEIRAELAELYRRWRAHLAQALRDKQAEGIVELEDDPDAVASLLFALGDGIGLQLLTDPEWSSDSALAAGARMARRLLGAA